MGNEVVIKNRFHTARLDEDSILYMEKDRRKVFVYTEDENFWEYCKMKDMLDRMGTQMYHCHHSLAVNLDNVQEISCDELILFSGKKLYMCRSALSRVKKAWRRHIGVIQ
ncbi:MAG: LytTR family transcriptional regulator [Clostridiales Family XIII bacterium]|jgi:DNA-binding LytR/AlgR family response regulator|nr:LytTR family transcriptional regulator [Clostridiales Family XIII bacterium]